MEAVTEEVHEAKEFSPDMLNYESRASLISSGLRNCGNTCYLNSVFQCLAHCPPLLAYFTQCWPYANAIGAGEAQPVSDVKRKEFLRIFVETIKFMWNGSRRDYNPRELNACVIESVPEFRPYGQQDAHEALVYILNNLHDELYQVVPKELFPARKQLQAIVKGTKKQTKTNLALLDEPYHQSIITDAFNSFLVQTCICDSCNTESLRTVNEMGLCLALPSKQQLKEIVAPSSIAATSATAEEEEESGIGGGGGAGGGVFSYFKGFFTNGYSLSLHDCLKEYFQVEKLSGEEIYVCDECKDKKEATKQFHLMHGPQILSFSLRRFNTKAMTNKFFGNAKNTVNVKYPITGLDMSNYMHPSMVSLASSSSFVYDLIGIVRHTGGLNSGHYISVCKNPYSGQWFEYDDEVVSKINGLDQLQYSDAYCLFYSKRASATQKEMKEKIYKSLSPSNNNNNKRDHVYLSLYYLVKFETLAEPGPMDNLTFTCLEHGAVVPPTFPDVYNRSLLVPNATFSLLTSFYSFPVGTVCANISSECAVCKEEFEKMNSRREEEAEKIKQLVEAEKDDAPHYVLSKSWANGWDRFITNKRPVLG